MPCLPFAGIQSGVYVVPEIGSTVWVEFEQGNPDYPIWVRLLLGLGRPRSRRSRSPRPRASRSWSIQTPLENTLMISDVPGPTGGILLKSSTGALISISDTGIIISNGQGATIAMTGPASRSTKARWRSSEMPGFLIQQGATVMCAHGGQALATVPSPVGQPDGPARVATIAAPWAVAGCPGVPPAVPPCVTAQWAVGTDARHLLRPAAGDRRRASR